MAAIFLWDGLGGLGCLLASEHVFLNILNPALIVFFLPTAVESEQLSPQNECPYGDRVVLGADIPCLASWLLLCKLVCLLSAVRSLHRSDQTSQRIPLQGSQVALRSCCQNEGRQILLVKNRSWNFFNIDSRIFVPWERKIMDSGEQLTGHAFLENNDIISSPSSLYLLTH